MVDMKCEGCVNAVKNKLQTVNGVKNVEVDLSNQVVRILGCSPVKTMTEALEQTGRKSCLIGQGILDEFLVTAAIAEFKGPDIIGVVRFAQVNIELARTKANFNGLSPGFFQSYITKHSASTTIPCSVSMDHSCQRSSVSIAQVLLMNQDDDDVIEEEESPCDHTGSSKQSSVDDFVKSSNKRKIMHCVMNPVAMKLNSLVTQ
ncbi:hypothetical protein Q3G72_016661 [Acer saccharum]|nr:hypothetical protein Q3G72_016661 [Acer saccharum]